MLLGPYPKKDPEPQALACAVPRILVIGIGSKPAMNRRTRAILREGSQLPDGRGTNRQRRISHGHLALGFLTFQEKVVTVLTFLDSPASAVSGVRDGIGVMRRRRQSRRRQPADIHRETCQRAGARCSDNGPLPIPLCTRDDVTEQPSANRDSGLRAG